MRTSLFLCLVLVSAIAGATPEIQTWETPQGTQVLFVEARELPMVDVQVLFHAGGSRNGDLPGLAEMTNRLLAEGADGLSADEISYGFESLGAVYGADSGYDSASVSLRSLSEKNKLDKAMINLIRVLTRPDFPDEAFERERKRMLVGLLSKKQNPGALARDAFYAAVFRDHPYALPKTGTEESLQAIKRDDVVEFHRRYYVAANAVIAIIGDLDRAGAEAMAARIARAMTVGKRAPDIPDVEPLVHAERVTINHPSQQTHILMGQPGIKRSDPDYFALYTGNHVLGGGGLVSRLFEEIRAKRGLSYAAYSYFSPMQQTGPFIAGLQTRTDQAEEAVRVLTENIQRYIAEGPTEEELEAAKKNITGGFPLRIDSNSEILAYLAAIGIYDLPLDYLETFNEKIEAVTVDEVRAVFQRHLSPDNFVTVMVGPADDETGEQAGQ